MCFILEPTFPLGNSAVADKNMKSDFKRVPALDKCFNILRLMAREKKPLGITEISSELSLSKSTVFNIIYTLADLGVLEYGDKKYRFGPKLYVLGKAAEAGSKIIQIIHPYLDEISQNTHLSAFLGMRSGDRVVIVDKAESPYDFNISSQIGISHPLLIGAHGKAILSLQTDDKIDEFLSRHELERFTRITCVDKTRYREQVRKVRKTGIVVDKGEYFEGLRALAVPLKLVGSYLQMAIWTVGLKSQINDKAIPSYSRLLKGIAKKIEIQFSV